jgi:nucleotide-binding universal stress UspA family protein
VLKEVVAMRIIVSAEGSTEGVAARAWCREHVQDSDQVIAVVGMGQIAELMLTVSPLVDLADERRVVEQTHARFDHAGVNADVRLLNKDQYRAVLDVAAAEHADHIVVGKQPRGAVADTLLNDTAAHLIHRPPCPVLVVPATAAERSLKHH